VIEIGLNYYGDDTKMIEKADFERKLLYLHLISGISQNVGIKIADVSKRLN
jgi:hypothetical protein